MPAVRDRMRRDVATCLPSDKVVDCARLMDREDLVVVPVVESVDTRLLVGVISDRDLALGVLGRGLDPRYVTVEDCMTDELVTVGEDDALASALDLMRQEGLACLPVVDEHGALLGVVEREEPRGERTAVVPPATH